MKHNIYKILFAAVALLLSVYVGNNISDSGGQSLMPSLFIVGVIFWIVWANQNWWTVIPCSTVLLGTFEIPFKVYPHEVAVGLAFLALLPTLIIKKQNPNANPYPIILVLLLYLILCFANSAYQVISISDDWKGCGNVLRSYMWGFWPLLVMIAFSYYGDLKGLRTAYILLVVVALIQTIGSLMSVIFQQQFEIPGIHYVFSRDPGEDTGTLFFPLRSLSVVLIILSIFIISTWKHFYKYLGVLLLIPSLIIMLLSGGRSTVFTGVLYLFLWLYFYSHKKLLAVMIAVICLGTFVVNVNPDLLKELPLGVERSLTVLVFNKEFKEEMFGGGAGSDDWHHNLADIGYQRWTTNVGTVLFGYGTRATSPMDDYLSATETWYRYALSAADTGSYENTFWDILCSTGLVGFFLYAWLFLYFLRMLYPYIRDHQPLTSLQDFTVWWAFAALVENVLTCLIRGGLPGMSLVLAAIAEKIIREKKRADHEAGIRSQKSEISISSSGSPVRVFRG
jgi:hypothetical protein